MKRGLKIILSWICMFSLFASPLSVFGASSGDPVWPNPGAIQLSKTAQPTGSPGEWEITLKAEGKNVRTSSDIVLVIDKSGSMDQRSGWFTPSKMDNAKDAAKKFVDNLLLPNSSTQIAVVSFNKSSTLISGFKGAGNKNALKNAIEGIEPTGGTNIQAGLKKASDLLANSIAQNKIIVLLSDGEPTFSFKGTHAEGFNWPNSSNNFSITSFDYGKTLGTGADFTFKNYDCNIFGFNCKNDTYNINNYQVKDNGIGTISEAKIAKDAGLKIFSVGLEVSNNSNAINVLKDIQSEGYFPANSDELNTIFREMAGKISYAAQNAKVVDPMGDMFNLKKQGAQVSPQDYSASQGTVTWNAATETFTWDVGNIAEGEPASLTYKVVLDQSKNPVSNVLYPTNGKTTIEYTNVTGEKVSKDFEVPKVSIGNGSILMKGYKVNASGKPVNAEGVEVEGPEFAELLYSEYYKDQNGNEALPIGAAEYSVSAKNIAGYQLKVGENPVSIRLTATNPTPTVWFGYEEAVERTVTVHYLEQGTEKELAQSTTVKGVAGQKVTLTAVEIPGYTPENKTAEYVVKAEGSNEYTFYYVANKQSVEVQYLEQGTNKKLADPTTVEGVTGQTLELKAIGIPGYTPVEPSFNYKLGVENAPHIFYYTPSEQTVTVKFVEKELGNELIEPRTVTGHTGKTVTLEAAEIPGYTPENKTAEYVVKAEGSNEYTFYYVAHKQSVEVQYLEQGTNKKLADPTTVEGVTGQTLELKAIGIPGYTPVEPSFNYELGVENAPHIFYYTANATEPDDSRTLTVRYVDQQTGKDLLNPTERSGKVGEKITLTAENYTDTVTGAVYKPHAYEVPYTFTEDQVQQFVFKYAQGNTGQERIVTIHHVDRETDEELIEPTASKGIAGTNLVFYPEPISVTDVVYFPEQTKYDIKITLDAGQEYTIYYVKGEPDELAQVTVSYRDRETGNELAAQEIYKGRIGAGIEFSAKQVEGYTPEVANHTHTWTDDPNQTYVFYYTKNAPADRQLTVKYLENGTNRQLASQTTVSGKPGETKTLTAVSVSGYNPVKATASYTFSDQEGQEYAFYYTKKSSDSSGSSGSDNSGSSNPNPSPSTPEVDPLPPLPPLPAVPPKLETENHYDYINGYPDGTVKPLNNITREEVAAIFYRLLDDESRSAYLKTGNSFSDVGNTRWSNKHISTMENAGIITGYPDGIFKPGQYITRAEFAAIASRFDKLDERQNDTFTDITGHWAEKYIASAANKGWIKGYTDGTFKPEQYITRAEAAKFINSVLNRKVDKDGIHKDTKQWPDNISGMWYYYDILEATNHHEYSRSESGVEVWSEIKASRVYP
ncbi:S-layer homology domain-containing protein [Paenibacillus macerans]|uniref:S-layer homology domain-containing protein n=2 Tax=Paenibacillus macerans TaxID=44252 RepID=UPI000DFA85FB|nr:S-layer homology domain-containing protein [Paenibacillus macerans]MCY7561501.1 S-layer homology domain-containing protein [Paenibacillus macerans]SUD26908.1 S-layer protein [Paenibacillus macerans]